MKFPRSLKKRQQTMARNVTYYETLTTEMKNACRETK